MSFSSYNSCEKYGCLCTRVVVVFCCAFNSGNYYVMWEMQEDYYLVLFMLQVNCIFMF